MGLLDEAIREHLELKRKHGADDAEIARQEAEVFGAGSDQGDADPYALDAVAEGDLEAPPDRAAEAGITGDREEPEFEWQGLGSGDLEVPDYVTAADDGAEDETRVDVGEADAEARLEEERPPEVTDAPTELFQPLDVDRSEEPEDALEEAAAPTAEEASGEEPESAPVSEDETVLYETPPVVEDEEPAADELRAEEPLAEEPDADELGEGVRVDEAFVADPSRAEGADAVVSDEQPELGGEEPEDAPEGVEEEPLDEASQVVEEEGEEEAPSAAQPIEEAEPPREEEMEAPPLAETEIEAAAAEDEVEAEEQRLEHEAAAEDEPLEYGPAGEDVVLEEEEEDVDDETDLPDLSASLEPSPFARPEKPAEAFGPEPAEDPGEDPGEAEAVDGPPDEGGWDEVGIAEEDEPETATAPDDTAYLPPEERPLYEPVPDAEARPEEPLDIPPPATEVEPGPEPEPLAEAGDTAFEPEPPQAELAPEPREAELDVTESDLPPEEEGDEADPSPPRGFFEDTAEYEGIPPERRPPRDPDFET